MKDLFLKFLFFCFVILVSTVFVIGICYFQAKIFDTDYLLNYTLIISIICSILAVCVWSIKYKDNFEKFLVFICILFFNMLLIYIGPLTVNRSLSTFIYFYTVENRSVKKDFYEESYYKDFVARRYTDGQIFGFLSCEDNVCRPNIRTKMFYYFLYPIGKITASDKHYKEFKTFMDSNK